MMDTVWIRLHVVITSDPASEFSFSEEAPEHFMFGPTGIVRFKTEGNRTTLLNSSKICIAEVTETSDYIMDILRKMRGTEGRLNKKVKKKVRNGKK